MLTKKQGCGKNQKRETSFFILWVKLEGKNALRIKTLTDTGKFRFETDIITTGLCNAVIPLIGL